MQLNVPRAVTIPPVSIVESTTHFCTTRCALSEIPVKVKISGRSVGCGATYTAQAPSSGWEGTRAKSANPFRVIVEIVLEARSVIGEAWLDEASFNRRYIPLTKMYGKVRSKWPLPLHPRVISLMLRGILPTTFLQLARLRLVPSWVIHPGSLYVKLVFNKLVCGPGFAATRFEAGSAIFGSI